MFKYSALNILYFVFNATTLIFGTKVHIRAMRALRCYNIKVAMFSVLKISRI